MTKARRYQQLVPVVISFRWAFRLDLFRFEDALVTLFRKQVARWSWRCRVAVLGYAVRSNHAHLILVQFFDGHSKHLGISAMMRNVLSALAKAANAAFSHQGSILERTYRSHNLHTLGDLLRQYAYVHHQDAHHGPDDLASSKRTLVDIETADGLVCQIPIFPELCHPDANETERAAALDSIMAEMSTRATELERQGHRDATDSTVPFDPLSSVYANRPWFTALHEVGASHGLALDADVRLLDYVSILAVRNPEDWFNHRKLLREWILPRFVCTPRSAPRVGDIIDVRVHKVVEFCNIEGSLHARVVGAASEPPAG
jgi:hypothetical protein